MCVGMFPFNAFYGREPSNIFGTPAKPAKYAVVVENLGGWGNTDPTRTFETKFSFYSTTDGFHGELT